MMTTSAHATTINRPTPANSTGDHSQSHSDAELEFMAAIQEYKARSGRMFPTWSEVLEVLREIGYQKPLLVS